MYGLNIHLQSFNLNKDIIGQNDKVRVSITTIPEDSKQTFVIEAKKMNNIHHFFTINIDKHTEKIIFVFRKKSFIQNDPIIASTIIHTDEIPKSKDDKNNTELKQINLYEPISKINDRGQKFKGANRRIIGQMEIQFGAEDEFPTFDYNTKYQTSKTLNGKGYSKININNNENCYQNNINNNNIYFVDNRH